MVIARTAGVAFERSKNSKLLLPYVGEHPSSVGWGRFFGHPLRTDTGLTQPGLFVSPESFLIADIGFSNCICISNSLGDGASARRTG